VELALLEPYTQRFVKENKLILQAFVKALKKQYALTNESLKEHVRKEYYRVLSEKAASSIDLKAWLQKWFQAYTRATAYNVAKINKFIEVKDFLRAIAVKIALV
jgi:ABC-type nitrate/sulfonate/bicarbonate transport system substrate-binding protein